MLLRKMRNNAGRTGTDQRIASCFHKNLRGNISRSARANLIRPIFRFARNIYIHVLYRLGVIVKTSVKSRASIFVEFALQVLAGLLKSSKFEPENQEDVARLDPFVPLIFDCLQLKYDKVRRVLIGMFTKIYILCNEIKRCIIVGYKLEF